MTLTTRKIWVGVGAVSIVGGAIATPTQAQDARQPKDATAASGTVAGAPVPGRLARPRSGEAYLTDGGPSDTRVRIYRDIGLMRGHMRIGAELVEAGQWDEALPHFLHPTEELYGVMERYITLHKVTPFKRQLSALSQSVKARSKPAFDQALKVVDDRLTNALTTFQQFMKGQPLTSFAMRSIVEMLKVAGAEYALAIENGRFTKPIEYQDSRGFVLQAEAWMKAQNSELAKIDAGRLAEIKKRLAELKKAWPSAIPPDQPVSSPADVTARIGTLEKLSERFF